MYHNSTLILPLSFCTKKEGVSEEEEKEEEEEKKGKVEVGAWEGKVA